MSNYDGDDLDALLGAVPCKAWIGFAVLTIVAGALFIGAWVMF